MPNKTEIWQGTLALMILKTIETLGPLHGYGIARRIEQISGDRLSLNYGTLYPSLLKLEQEGWIVSEWGVSENNRKAKYYKLTRSGRKQLGKRRKRVESDHRDRRPVSRPRGGSVMSKLRAWLLRFKGLFLKDAREREFADELESHLQMHIDDNIRAGMSPQEARRVALMKLGGIDQAKEAYRDRATMPFLESVVQDLRFTLRQLRKNPAFTFTATVMVALGIGASVAIFAFVDAALIKPLPYQNPSRLLFVTETTPEIPRANFSYLDYLDWKKLNKVFDSLEVYGQRGFVIRTSAGMEMVDSARVSAGFFRTLGVSPLLGRDFYAGEDLPEAPRTLILSYASWQKRFGGKQEIVGQPLTLDETPYTIIGVLPQHFHFAPVENAEFWTTLNPGGGCFQRDGVVTF